ncbi:hypothetical protein HPB47_011472 [Ixodes persulcatus]|uniref:Uncharacterized protein n=1 Tax=Ixodes persulcatus TaxID=34615 RepID=A0AC60NWF5_IXOPE|nr:hypothetical protein HPB47_011472 [Ixodes persulcatus]
MEPPSTPSCFPHTAWSFSAHFEALATSEAAVGRTTLATHPVLRDIPRVPPVTGAQLYKPPIAKKMHSALRRTETESTTGLNGFPTESYITFREEGETPVTQARRRPITSLNGSYKLLASMLAQRLHDILPDMLSKRQTCSVVGRSVQTRPSLTRDVLYFTNDRFTMGFTASLDQAMFDQVEHFGRVRPSSPRSTPSGCLQRALVSSRFSSPLPAAAVAKILGVTYSASGISSEIWTRLQARDILTSVDWTRGYALPTAERSHEERPKLIRDRLATLRRAPDVTPGSAGSTSGAVSPVRPPLRRVPRTPSPPSEVRASASALPRPRDGEETAARRSGEERGEGVVRRVAMETCCVESLTVQPPARPPPGAMLAGWDPIPVGTRSDRRDGNAPRAQTPGLGPLPGTLPPHHPSPRASGGYPRKPSLSPDVVWVERSERSLSSGSEGVAGCVFGVDRGPEQPRGFRRGPGGVGKPVARRTARSRRRYFYGVLPGSRPDGRRCQRSCRPSAPTTRGTREVVGQVASCAAALLRASHGARSESIACAPRSPRSPHPAPGRPTRASGQVPNLSPNCRPGGCVR